jgi:hypothetical protein
MINIKKINAWPPAQIEANTLYFVKDANDAALIQLYLSSIDGTSTKRVMSKEDFISDAILFASETPALDVSNNLWYNTIEGSLYIKYDDGVTVSWIEAMPSVAMPEFAGNGSASTVARSDHNHDTTYAKSGVLDW